MKLLRVVRRPAPLRRGLRPRLTPIILCALLLAAIAPAAPHKTARPHKQLTHAGVAARLAAREDPARIVAGDPASALDWIHVTGQMESVGLEQWSVLIVDLESGETVAEHQPDQRLVAASNRKIVVMGLALDLLGPDYTWSTELCLTDPLIQGRPHHHGDLLLRSHGDPSLTPELAEDPRMPISLFEQWAEAIRARGIDYIHGDLIIDASAFGADQNVYPAEWDDRHRDRAYAPIPSSFAICGNLLRIGVRPASAHNHRGQVSIHPSMDNLRIVNNTVTRSRLRSRLRGITTRFGAEPTELIVGGRVRTGQGEEVAVIAMREPLEYAGTLLRCVLEDRQVTLTGQVRVVTDTDALPPTFGEPLGRHASPPLADLVTAMMRDSDNFLAEQIWRTVGYELGGRGDLPTSRRIERAWLIRQGLMRVAPGADGSGLAVENTYSARELVTILARLYDSPHRDRVLSMLPLSGHSGTLRRRAFDSPHGRVAAKTGSLRGARALSGFIMDQAGSPRYVFSVLGNVPDNRPEGRLIPRTDELVGLLIEELDGRADTVAAGTAGLDAATLN